MRRSASGSLKKGLKVGGGGGEEILRELVWEGQDSTWSGGEVKGERMFEMKRICGLREMVGA